MIISFPSLFSFPPISTKGIVFILLSFLSNFKKRRLSEKNVLFWAHGRAKGLVLAGSSEAAMGLVRSGSRPRGREATLPPLNRTLLPSKEYLIERGTKLLRQTHFR